MALTDLQRKKLIESINNININTVIPYFQTGEISFDDVPNISNERKQYIIEQLDKIPNPEELKEWKEIEPFLNDTSNELLEKLNSYINNWEGIRPAKNHVDEARDIYSVVENKIKQQAKDAEMQEWESIDPFSKNSLINYLYKYPNTVHRDEIDDSLWNLVKKDDIQDIQEYINFMSHGLHINEANKIIDASVVWESVKNSDDIFVLDGYIKDNPESPFIREAQILFISLKKSEIQDMKRFYNSYDVQRLIDLVDGNIISEKELIKEGIMTQRVLESIRYSDIRNDLPDIDKAIKDSVAECKDGFTDVFFFGVPSTGKTCVLMGLSRSDSLHINLASAGGDYAAALQQYTDYGITVPRTLGGFVTTLEGTISNSASDNYSHKVNLVEMSGEEFAFMIANNPDHEFSFEDMGTGATQLLSNGNRKVFFLIIDPTVNTVRINREIDDGFDEDTGNCMNHIESCVVNQRSIIQKMVDLFGLPKNKEIMKNVDSIHIIVTKSDTLGNTVEREETALKIFNDKYRGDILMPLYNVCKEYNINYKTRFYPKLYTFSLGNFYIGGLYEYDQTDSNRLIKAIQNSSHGTKKTSWWDRLKEIVNK